MPTIHVIGAGLAGLAAAVRLSAQGRAVVLWEAAPQAGGRCRSFYDATLECRIDNGNHLLLSANRAVLAYLDQIGARDRLIAPPEPRLPFIDVTTGERWTVQPNLGPLPWWLLVPGRRVLGSRLQDYGGGLGLMLAGPRTTVADCLKPHGRLYRRFWEPLVLAVLNTPAEQAAALPLKRVMLETFAKGGRWCRPLVARDGLADSLVEPALQWLEQRQVPVHFGQRLRALGSAKCRVNRLDFGNLQVPVAAGDQVILALPPGPAAELVPGLRVPADGQPIVNAHFRVDPPLSPPEPSVPLVGLIGTAAHWVFLRGAIASVTVSAAHALVDRPAAEIAAQLWRDVARAFGRDPAVLPPYRIIKERRATFVQSPANQALRPGPRTSLANLTLAGDWTATGLPATLESAVLSGHAAADLLTGQGQAPHRR